MQVSHRFVKLSERDSGKQHVFTWRDDDGKFLCHAMYQSGADQLEISGQAPAMRGHTLRILTKEIPCDQEAALAPSRDSESGTLRLQVDGEGWQASDYEGVAKTVLNNADLSCDQQAAILCQMSSLYNLMATRYGKLFDIPLVNFSKASVDQLMTDTRLRQVSNWFSEQALAVMQHRTPELEPLPESDVITAHGAPKLHFSHGIVVRNNQKIHTFEMKDADGKLLLSAQYQSGTMGETIVINYPLADGKSVAVPYNLMAIEDPLREGLLLRKMQQTQRALQEEGQPEIPYDAWRDETAHLYTPVTADYQLQKLDYYRQMYGFSEEQQAATLLMLGSVTRLFATRYQREFKPITIEDGKSLHHYVRDKDISEIADELIASATKVLRNDHFEYPFLTTYHDHFGTDKARDALEAGKPALDISQYPPLDYWAMSFTPEGPRKDVFDQYPHHVDHSVGDRLIKEGRNI